MPICHMDLLGYTFIGHDLFKLVMVFQMKMIDTTFWQMLNWSMLAFWVLSCKSHRLLRMCAHQHWWTYFSEKLYNSEFHSNRVNVLDILLYEPRMGALEDNSTSIGSLSGSFSFDLTIRNSPFKGAIISRLNQLQQGAVLCYSLVVIILKNKAEHVFPMEMIFIKLVK